MAANRMQGLFTAGPNDHWTGLLNRQATHSLRQLEACAQEERRIQQSVCHRIWSSEDSFTLEIDLPGHSLEDFDVTLVKDQLQVAVKAGIATASAEETVQIRIRERAPLQGQLQIQLPFRADPAQVEVTYINGVFKVVAQRPAADLPRQLEVKSAE